MEVKYFKVNNKEEFILLEIIIQDYAVKGFKIDFTLPYLGTINNQVIQLGENAPLLKKGVKITPSEFIDLLKEMSWKNLTSST